MLENINASDRYIKHCDYLRALPRMNLRRKNSTNSQKVGNDSGFSPLHYFIPDLDVAFSCFLTSHSDTDRLARKQVVTVEQHPKSSQSNCQNKNLELWIRKNVTFKDLVTECSGSHRYNEKQIYGWERSVFACYWRILPNDLAAILKLTSIYRSMQFFTKYQQIHLLWKSWTIVSFRSRSK